MPRLFSIATANTHESRALKEQNGLKPVAETGADVLLLQEVLQISDGQLKYVLESYGYEVVSADTSVGLVTAKKIDSPDIWITDSVEYTIHQPGAYEGLAKRLQPRSNRMRSRGLHMASFVIGTSECVIANTHPIIFPRFMSRSRQVRAIGRILGNECPDAENLILAGDMNHYPGPRTVDLRMQHDLGLDRAQFQEKSWPVRGSVHEKYIKVGAKILGRPLEAFDAQLDAVLHRGVTVVDTRTVDFSSDHKAQFVSFSIS